MNYLDKYDNFVMKKCLDTRRVNTFELNNLANGRVTKSHFGGYVAQKLTKEQLIVAIKSKFEGRYVNEKVIEDLEDLELAELLQIYESEYYWDNLHETPASSSPASSSPASSSPDTSPDEGVSSADIAMDVWLAEAAREAESARTPNSILFDREPPRRSPVRSPVTPGRASMLWHRSDIHNPLSETAINQAGKLQRFENQKGHPLAGMKSQTTGRPPALKYPDDIQESLNKKYSRPAIAALEEQMQSINGRTENELRNLQIGMDREARGAFLGFGLDNAF
jgi:hypothetical protein